MCPVVKSYISLFSILRSPTTSVAIVCCWEKEHRLGALLQLHTLQC